MNCKLAEYLVLTNQRMEENMGFNAECQSFLHLSPEVSHIYSTSGGAWLAWDNKAKKAQAWGNPEAGGVLPKDADFTGVTSPPGALWRRWHCGPLSAPPAFLWPTLRISGITSSGLQYFRRTVSNSKYFRHSFERFSVFPAFLSVILSISGNPFKIERCSVLVFPAFL